ncbi:hypothetical protein J3458_013216 [Metarhizium acridum]|uniref:uncharacterized protein n=1 Tax=Metarhizium acridum TaxID=92637 RepID=UPI001C6CF174|nr:hypothetical protein J3458_013216 [Metarhizium acridum]
MSEAIKAVTIVGTADNVGSAIFKKLTAADQFKVRVLGRNDSTSKFADQVDVVNVDFDSVDWLTAALAGQDAVIAVLGFHAQPKHRNIVDAAIAAGVKRFLPSEFGSNSNKPNIRKLPHFAEETKNSSLTYTIVNDGPPLDFGIHHNFLLNATERKASIFDGGNVLFSTTAVNTMTDAIVAILPQPDAASNCVVYVQDVKLKQNKLLKLTGQADGDKPWTVESVSLDTLTRKSDERVAKGLLVEETFAPYAWRSIDAAYGGNFEETDNELLGLWA